LGVQNRNHKVKGIVIVGDDAEDGAFLHAQLRQEHFIGGNHLGKRRRLQHMQIGYRRDHNAGQGFRAAELERTNVATPENFVKILAVARSRNISCDIILQNISQIKSKYKDDWETIIGNCDSLVYLGGNDYSTFEYISKLLGKQTIRTKGQSIGKGSHGSSSDSYQVTGRELMTPDEVRRMKRSDCLVMISGEAPVRDKKYNLFDHPNLKYTPDYRSPRGLLHRFATPIPAPEGYTMPPDYMAQAGTVSLAYVAELTCPDITEDLYDELQEWEESLL